MFLYVEIFPFVSFELCLKDACSMHSESNFASIGDLTSLRNNNSTTVINNSTITYDFLTEREKHRNPVYNFRAKKSHCKSFRFPPWNCFMLHILCSNEMQLKCKYSWTVNGFHRFNRFWFFNATAFRRRIFCYYVGECFLHALITMC